MTHTALTPQASGIRLGTLIIVTMTGILGFALGQAWPTADIGATGQISSEIEDWHGNVRRSNWRN
ncbi:hypothetical protein [Ruegeria sp. EL01]|jgi:hypothetical protein|uniref:hypothetical protein n=1 Tax=Ruegeria sp. EL01 TaxID=2107578 RepID=UPI0013C4EA45|nr:hypothetical protein [Ruegeria sp. EL01]